MLSSAVGFSVFLCKTYLLGLCTEEIPLDLLVNVKIDSELYSVWNWVENCILV